ncbi:MAG: outer rane lipoprotein omp16 precursor [Sediminibacterium sp.]|nr:outer rane lipoprotein omp16 precursor [Sediminibacterium sp.]
MKSFLLCLALSITSVSFSQVYDPEHVSAKAVKLYEKALDLLKDDQIKEGIPLLAESIREDSNFVDAYLSLAGAFGQLKKYDQAVKLYEKARSKDPAYFILYSLPYSINLAGQGRFADALAAVNSFLTYPKLNERSIKSAGYRERSYAFALAYAAQHPNSTYAFTPVNLGDSVNSPQSEYYPSVTVTDSLLVFTRKTEHNREDFVESRMLSKNFGASRLINGDINLEPKKGAISVSQDGEWMVFAAQLMDQSYQSWDIYISYQTPTGWSEPQNLGPNVNTDFYESGPSLSPDKRALYFCSNRPGGSGGRDLYVSYRQPNGKWGPAVNLGAAINSAGDEQAPYIHADNQTLYYTSDGLPGYGGSDLFVIRKDANGQWGAPENLGYPINTIENEGSLAVSADGLIAYYASDRSDSRGGLDLYKFDLRPDIRPYRTLYVKGKVIDKKTNKPLPSSVELVDNSNNNALMKVQTDELGEYFITLPTGKDYTFTVNRKGYLFYSELYPLSTKTADSVYKKDIYLQPVELNAVFTFNNIQFANNSFQLPPAGFIELDKLLQVLAENPSLKVEISGHTDNVGKPDDNMKLSANRAKALVDYLVSKGIDLKRLTYKGYGSTQPIAENTTEAGRAKNRRTTFTVTGI